MSISLGRFDDQCHIAACQGRHIKFELHMAERPSFGGKFRGFNRAFNFRYDFGTFDGFLRLIPHDDLKKGALARKPGFGVEQLQVQRAWRAIRWRICFRRRSIATRWRSDMQRSGAEFFHDGAMLRIHAEFQGMLAFGIQRKQIVVVIGAAVQNSPLKIYSGINQGMSSAAIFCLHVAGNAGDRHVRVVPEKHFRIRSDLRDWLEQTWQEARRRI